MTNLKLPRRRFLHLAAGAAALPAVSRSAWAQAYPSRPVTLLIAVSAGSSPDVILRSLATATERHLGQSIIIENRPGASTTLAPELMATTARPDGYTVAHINPSVFRAPFLRKTKYDPSTDFTYVIGVVEFTFGVVVRSDAQWRTLQEFVADAKANPGKITFGTTGADTVGNIVMLRIAKQHNINWVHVPYKGGPEEYNALLGGHIHAVSDASGWAPYVESGQFRLLTTFGEVRAKDFPNVPTLRESGIDMAMSGTYGIAGPKGMDANVIRVLHDSFKKGMDEPSFTATVQKFYQSRSYLSWTLANFRSGEDRILQALRRWRGIFIRFGRGP